ncbi:MAG: hypothetical protein QM713_08085 [Arachnia sp.]
MDRIERLIRDAKPPAAPDAGAEEALARILAAPSALDQRPADEPAPTRIVRLARPWSRVASVAAVLMLAAALFLSPMLGGVGATAEAASVLDAAARAAVEPPARPDQYWKVTSYGVHPMVIGEGNLGDAGVSVGLEPEVMISYVAVDGSRSGWLVQAGLPFLRQISGPPVALPHVEGRPYSYVLPPAEDAYRLAELSLDPRVLQAQLYQRSVGQGNSRDGAALEAAASILRSGYASAELLRALYSAVKLIPGVIVVGRSQVTDGRRVIVLGRDEPNVGQHFELLFDEETGAFVGERTGWDAPGNGTSEVTYTRELVDAIDDDPNQIFEK